MSTKLTAKMESFARLIALKNYSISQAFIEAYQPKTATKKTIQENASRKAKDSKIQARIQELREKIVEQPLIADKAERMELLTTIMRGQERTRDKLSSVELLSRLDGDFVTKSVTETNINVSLKQYSNDDLLAMLQAARQQGQIVDGSVVTSEPD